VVQLAVAERRFDQAAAVRDAVMELVGNYVQSRPEILDQYCEVILDRSAVWHHTHTHALMQPSVVPSHIRARRSAGQGHQRAEASRENPHGHL
jgi:hypothetical protein